MAASQKLRTVLDARRASRPCWRCSLTLPRHNSTRIPGSSKRTDEVPYSQVLRQGFEETLVSHFPNLPLYGVEPSPGISDKSERASSQRLRKPRIRMMLDGRAVPSHSQSEIVSSAPQEPRIRRIKCGIDDQQLASGMEPQPNNSMATMPRITRFMSEGRLAPLPTQSDVVALATKEPRIRRKSVKIDDQQVASGKDPQSNIVATVRKPRITRFISESRPAFLRTGLKIKAIKTISKPRIRVVQNGRSVPLRSLPEFKSLYPQMARMRRIQRMSVIADGQQVASSARSQSRRKRTLKRPRIRMMSTGRPVVLGTRNFLRSVKVGPLLPLRKIGTTRLLIGTTRLIQQEASVSKRGLVPYIRPISSLTPPFAEPPDVVSKKPSKRRGHPLVRACIPKDAPPLVGEDEACHDELTSVLDVYKDLYKPDLSDPTREIGHLFPSTRFSSHNSVNRRMALSESRTLKQPNLSASNKSFSSRTSGAPNRRYATATSQTTKADARVNPAIIGSNPDELVKGNPRGIREALRLWQEQHDIALADTSGLTPSGTLGDTQNLFTQSGEDESFTAIARDEEAEDDNDVSFGSDASTLDIFAPQVFLRRGDLVELVAASEPILAVFVRNVTDQCQFYTIRGEWVNREPGGARWAVSRFMNPDDLNEILPYLPAEEVADEKMNRLQPIDVHAPRGAGAKIIEQMTLFHQAADAVFRKHADRINRLYEIIAPPEAFADRTYMSLKDIAMKVLTKKDPSELTQPMMWAIHRAVAQCQNVMWDQMNYRQNPIYEIYPQQSLKDISKVRAWVREYQEGIIHDTTNDSMFSIDSTLTATTRSLNPIAMFVKKARAAIQQSRQTRPLSESGFIGPSTTRIEMEEGTERLYKEFYMQEFDINDKTIIHYLDVWATSSYVNAYTNLASLGPMILRAIGMYEGFELDESRGFTLLQELGVVTPWENRTVYKLRNLRLPGHDGGSGEISRLVLEARKEARALDLRDSMEGLRKDWGDMPVFCIDSAETLERDDGVSLELLENDPSTYWIHVHVANPSAFITPDSAIAKFAASLAESVYFPERKYPMLNPSLTKDQFSLANDRPCITFSAKISADGDILEKKITPGMVRNVHYLTPQMVGQGLGLTETDEEPETMSILTVGGHMPTQFIEDSNQTAKALTDPEHIKILRKLLQLGEAARHKRAQAGAPDFYSSARIATTYPVVYLSNHTGKPFTINDKRVTQFEGDPIISLQRTTAAYGHVAKMVSDLMIIAGDVSASWCSARNIPIPYRGILRNPEPASPPDLFKRDILDPKIAKYGHAQQHDLLRYMRLVGQAHASDRPLDHPALGLPAYCKATSPLRRYVDMYAHWQIEAAIRHEAATGTSLVGADTTNSHYLPFPRHQVEEYAAGSIHRERKIAVAKTSSTRHWICQALFRALYFHEAALPERFDVTAIAGRRGWRGHHAGWLESWNVKVLMRDGETVRREGGWRVGDVWEARLCAVDPYHTNIEMEAVKLVERERVGQDDCGR